MLRGNTVGARNAAKTHCLRGHPFNEENTRVDRRGRVCRQCHREKEKARMQAKREASKDWEKFGYADPLESDEERAAKK